MTMHAQDFQFRFNFSKPNPIVTPFHHNENLRAASVLIPLIKRSSGLTLLLTKRASHLRHHPGQISFPGGGKDETDKDAIETALRETEEEIKVDRSLIEVIGQLPEYATVSNYNITPIIAFIDPNHKAIHDPNEVEEVFEVPLQFFMNPTNRHQVNVYRNGQHHPIHFMPYQDKFIWGATAALIDQMVNQLSN